MTCKKCGKEFEGNFCPSCGTRFDSGGNETTPEIYAESKGKRTVQKKSKKKIIIISSIAATVLSILAVFLLYLFNVINIPFLTDLFAQTTSEEKIFDENNIGEVYFHQTDAEHIITNEDLSDWIKMKPTFETSSNHLVLKNNKNIKLVHTSGSYIYYFQTSESTYNDLYCLNLYNGEVKLVDKNIVSDNLQLDNGYLYYTKSTDLMYKQSFRRIEISEKSEPEDVIAVNNGISVKGSKIINSNSYVCDDYFYNGSWYSGNLYYYIYRYDSAGNVKMLCDYIFPVTNMTVYKSNLYFDGINLNEDGIYTVSINGGSYKTLYKGSANIISITEDRIFFSSGTNSEGVIDLQYISVNGGSAKKLIDGKIENIIVCDNWVYYIDKNDSHQLKRINILSNNVQNLTEGACKNFLVNNDNSILYYLSEYSDKTQILRISIGNQITHIDEEPSKPTINSDDILGKYKIENYHGMEEYCPNFTLLNNNTFTFEINNFSGMHTINGTYTFDGVVLTLNAYDGADKIVFEVKGKDRLLFMNDMLGDTYYGDVFVKESNP